MANFEAPDILSGNIMVTNLERLIKKGLVLVAKQLSADLQVDAKAKAEVKAMVLQALAERNLLKGTVNRRGLESGLELQLELRRMEIEEA